MPYTPTPEQQRIIAHRLNRHGRVLAGPGTGKSATLVALITELMQADARPNVRLLTFTRAATAELARKVSEHPASAALRPSTVHSFAISVLIRNPGSANLPAPLRIADDWEYVAIVRPTLARRIGVDVRTLDRLVREMAAGWESLREEHDARIDPAQRARFLGGWLEHRSVFGYTLLAELPYSLRSALRDHPDVEGVDYHLLIVDEYQDLNACDLDLLHLISQRGCRILAAGDDDQSIYSMRKAAPEGIRRFLQDYPGASDYNLSVAQRCGTTIIDWACHVIEGDPDRPHRPRLTPSESCSEGAVALLAFQNEVAEARGIAKLVHRLIEREGVPPNEILILLRSDYMGHFSGPIKEELDTLGIPFSDPDSILTLLAEPVNRRFLELLRLLDNGSDSLAWAALLHLEQGVGKAFVDYTYDLARVRRNQIGDALLDAYREGMPNAPGSSAAKARALVDRVLAWRMRCNVPEQPPEDGWGAWAISVADGNLSPIPSEPLVALLQDIDAVSEPADSLGRYIGQITPLAKDRALALSGGARIMTMGSAKGLTVRATIIGALEEGIIPRPEADLSEERRLLYVGMTRARDFLFGTWARRRKGPTARAGAPRVGGRRTLSSFLNGGPVQSQDGESYLRARWG